MARKFSFPLKLPLLYARFSFLDLLDFFEKISDCRSDPFALIDLDIPANSYMIACTNTQSFEEGENCASTISVEHLEPLFHTIWI